MKDSDTRAKKTIWFSESMLTEDLYLDLDGEK